MLTMKNILTGWKDKRDLTKRIERLERTMNKLQVTIDIALDSRVSYLETKFVELKHMKPVIEKMTSDIGDIKGAVVQKKKELPDSNQGIEVA
jgi:seryl-tRNA synthetase